MFRPLFAFIGTRYTRAKRRNHFVSFISLTSMIGLALGVVFTAAGSLSHRLFGQQGFRVWLIEVGSDVLNYTLVGLVIGLFG